MQLTVALGLCFLSLAVVGVQAAAPANPSANPRVGAVLNYLTELETRSDKRLLSGQFTNFGANGTLEIMDKIHQQSGHYPALVGFDDVDFPSGGLTTKIPNQSAIRYWRQGGLVTVGVHLYNPANPKGGGLRDKGVDLKELLREGSETHVRWMKELDQLAAGLDELQGAGIPVLWRPFHEMNGEWFWWGAKPPQEFIAVWRHMFDYFTKTIKLNNLIWVYGPNHRENAADYYPGDEYADVIGLDAYTDHVDPKHIKGYPKMAAIQKPFGFTEYGPHGAENPPGTYDYRKFVEGLQTHFPRSTFFMCWNEKWSLASNTHVKELLEHPWTINLEDLPAGLTGKTP